MPAEVRSTSHESGLGQGSEQRSLTTSCFRCLDRFRVACAGMGRRAVSVTVYTVPGSRQCRRTSEALHAAGVPFVEVPLSSASQLDWVTTNPGERVAPVVVLSEVEHWSGHRPDLIDQTVSLFSTGADQAEQQTIGHSPRTWPLWAYLSVIGSVLVAACIGIRAISYHHIAALLSSAPDPEPASGQPVIQLEQPFFWWTPGRLSPSGSLSASPSP